MFGKVAVVLFVVVAVVAAMVVGVVSATEEMKQESIHDRTVKHGKQERLTKEGDPNVHYDHERILGSTKAEKEFDQLSPEEAKQRLRELIAKMDRNGDGLVSKEELTNWILLSLKHLDDEEALEDFEEIDENADKKISWSEYLNSEYNHNEQEIRQLYKKNDAKDEKLLKDIDVDEKRWAVADLNGDGYLTTTEFFAFSHPENYEHMHEFLLEKEMTAHDKDNNGFISQYEFLEQAGTYKKESIEAEKRNFQELDKNKDGHLDKEELHSWVFTDIRSEAEEEADRLMKEADDDENERLDVEEILENVQTFVSSPATGHGTSIRYRQHLEDEL